jgi:hypothetical protein
VFESLVAYNGGEEWASVTMARAGTAVVHITLSGLMGWALVEAWRRRRYLNLAGTYLAAVAIHGTWNAMTVVMLVNGVAASQPEPATMPVISTLAGAAPFILIALGILCLTLLMTWNRRLRRDQAPLTSPTPVPAAPEPDEEPGQEQDVL